MTDIFDEISNSESNLKKDIFDELEPLPSRARSLVSAPIKGAIKGASELASFRDPFSAVLGFHDLNPLQKKAIEHVLATRNLPLEKGLERAGRLAVSTVGGPETLLAKGVRTAAGAGLGQLAEEVGAPDIVQNLAELSAFISPKFGSKILPKKSQTEAVEFLRSKGLNDREIAPLIKSEKRLKILSKFSHKGEKTKKIVSDISEKLSQGYENLKEDFKSLKIPYLKGDKALLFDESLEKVVDKINPRFQRLIAPDLEALRNKGVTGENLINFYQDINSIIGKQEGGRAVLGILKKPILEGLESIDPKLGKDFKKLNEFYSKKSLLSRGLKPKMFDDLISKGKSYALLGSLSLGNFGVLKSLLTKDAVGRLTTEFLINPRLQNLSNQMLKAIKDNKIPTAIKFYRVFKKEVSKKDKDLANKLTVPELVPANE